MGRTNRQSRFRRMFSAVLCGLSTIGPVHFEDDPNPPGGGGGGGNGQGNGSGGQGDNAGQQGGGSAPAVSGNADHFTRLRDEFSRLQGEANTVIDAAAQANRDLTADERTANDTRFSRMQTIQRTLNERVRFAGLAIAGDPAAPAGGRVQTPSDPPGRQEFDRSRGSGNAGSGPSLEAPTPEQVRQHRQAVNHYIRTGETSAARQFTLTTGTGTGVLVPPTVRPPVAVRRQANPFRAALIARGLTPIVTDTAESLTIPIFDDTANVADVIAQDAAGDNPKDPSLTNLALGANLYDSGTVWSSNMLLRSLSFDLIGFLEPRLQQRIDQRQTTAWTTALIAATVGVTTASTAGVTYAELLNWQHSIPLLRRMDGVFIVSDGLFRAMRGLTDTQGHPIYQESLRDEEPNRLLGWPIFISADLAAPAANAVSGVAVSASGVYIRDIAGRRIVRYVDEPSKPDQFGIREFAYGDMKFEAAAVRTLKHAAA